MTSYDETQWPKERLPTTRCFFEMLDENLLQEILYRLPVPDLMALQLTCSRMHRAISCKSFQEFHSQRNRDTQEMWFTLNNSTLSIPVFSLQRDRHGKYEMKQYSLNIPKPGGTVGEQNSQWFLEQASEGLLLFGNTSKIRDTGKDKRFMVVELVTGRCTVLPEIPIPWKLKLGNLYVAYMTTNSRDGTFSVIIIGRLTTYNYYTLEREALIYSSSAGTWTKSFVLPRSPSRGWYKDVLISPLTRSVFDSQSQSIWFEDSLLGGHGVLVRYTVQDNSVMECGLAQPEQNRLLQVKLTFLGMFALEDRLVLVAGTWIGPRKEDLRYIRVMETGFECKARQEWRVFMEVDLQQLDFAVAAVHGVAVCDGRHHVWVFVLAGKKSLLLDLKEMKSDVIDCNPISQNKHKDLCSRPAWREHLQAHRVQLNFQKWKL